MVTTAIRSDRASRRSQELHDTLEQLEASAGSERQCQGADDELQILLHRYEELSAGSVLLFG